jgi:transglutaminase-like putative cysteine protease
MLKPLSCFISELRNQKLKIKSQKQRSNPHIYFLFIFSILSFIFYLPSKVDAADNFTTDYQVNYTVSEEGQTHALMKVTLTNISSDYYYASSYKVELGFNHLLNITTNDLGGSITPKVTKTSNGYTIELNFNKKVVGIGNKQIFTLSFDTPDIAQKEGKIWEINIPGINDLNSFNTFNVDLEVPSSFGKPAYIKPAQNNALLHFTKEQLVKSGISLAFGTVQKYSYTLLYHLQNKNLFPIRTEIALPPNTNYQDISIISIDPEPDQVKKDTDGNWLAEYQLNPVDNVDIKVKGIVSLFLYPRKSPMSDKELSQYLQSKPYWQSSDNQILAIAKSLKTPEAIYDYVIKTLKYDFSRVTNSNNRIGAIGILQKPSSAVCLEFTDLFIALARAAGIPAREVDGYAYTENTRQRPLSLVQDILHAWPEYYDKDQQAWIMIDPTWGNTTGGVDYFHTLDFDHFAFVKKGLSSTYPIPAGGYKISGQQDRKDVYIAASADDSIRNNSLSIFSTNTNTYLSGLPIDSSVTITNKGPKVSNKDKLLITTNELSPQKQSITIGELLPFEKKQINFHFDKQSVLTNKIYTVTMSVAGKEYTETVRVVPFFVENRKLIGGITVVILAFIIFIIAFKARRIRVS